MNASSHAQSALPQVPDNPSLQSYTSYDSPVVREGYKAPGDGGIATYDHSSSACAASDNGSQVTAADGGCWNIDWASVGWIARPQLFGANFNGAITSGPDTAAVKAAAATGMPLAIDRPGSAGALFVPNDCIRLTHAGQEVFGAGRANDGASAVRIVLYANSPLATTGATAVPCAGIFDVRTGEPAPHFHDIGISFEQPDSVNPATFFNYPALISAVGQPRGIAERVGCYGSSVCFDLRGNSGGWKFDDVQGFAFKTGADATTNSSVYNSGMSAISGLFIRVDGALDVMRFHNVHIGPFGSQLGGVTGNQQKALLALDSSEVIGFQIGRCDGCYVDQLMNLNGLAWYASNGVYDPTNLKGASFATISDSDFDTVNGVYENIGTLQVTGSHFNSAVPASGQSPQALVIKYANVNVDNCHFGITGASNLPLVENASPVVNGTLQISNSTFGSSTYDVIMVQADASGATTLTGNVFGKASQAADGSAISYANPVIYKTSGSMTAIGNRMSDGPGASTGRFILSGDGHDIIALNTTFGWTATTPSSSNNGGIYSPNN